MAQDYDDTTGDVMDDEIELEEQDENQDDAESIIAKLIEQRDEYLDQLQRSRAEFINYRKRTDTEKLRLGEMFTGGTISKFLPVIDDWDRAMAAVPATEQSDSWFQGIQMIQGKFHQLLDQMGVKEVPGVGEPFDPAVHESVATEPGSRGETVVEVYQKGWKLGDTLLRAAMVKTGDEISEPQA